MLKIKVKLNKVLIFLWNLPKNTAIVLIRLYQLLLSPDHSWLKVKYPHGYCKHYPTCSEYSKQAISKFGIVKGGWYSAKRVARCNPWSEPKVDLINNI